MTATTIRPATRPATAPGGDSDVIHIVGDFQHWLDRLHLKIPRALCGASLEGDPDKPDPRPDSLDCAECARIDGRCDLL